mgnify:CR=1 FL=1
MTTIQNQKMFLVVTEEWYGGDKNGKGRFIFHSLDEAKLYSNKVGKENNVDTLIQEFSITSNGISHVKYHHH